MSTGAPIYRFDNFQLDPLARELRRNDEPIELVVNE